MKHILISLVFILLILGLTAYILQTVSKDKYTWTYAEECINNGYDENPIKCSHCISNFCKQFQDDEEIIYEVISSNSGASIGTARSAHAGVVIDRTGTKDYYTFMLSGD